MVWFLCLVFIGMWWVCIFFMFMLDLLGERGVLERGLWVFILDLLFEWGLIRVFVGELVVVINYFFFYL